MAAEHPRDRLRRAGHVPCLPGAGQSAGEKGEAWRAGRGQGRGAGAGGGAAAFAVNSGGESGISVLPP